MSFSTYTELVATLAVWIDKESGSTVYGQIPNAIQLCESKILRGSEGKGLRISRMIQRDTAVIGTDNRYSTVPTNYLEAITYALSDGSQTWRLDPAPVYVIADYREANDSAGPPRFYATTGTSQGREFEHYPTPDQNYTGTLTYYAKPTPLSPTNASNWILEDAPDAYLYGSLIALSEISLHFEAQPVWKTNFLEALVGLENAEPTQAGKLRTDIGLTAHRSGAYDINRDI